MLYDADDAIGDPVNAELAIDRRQVGEEEARYLVADDDDRSTELVLLLTDRPTRTEIVLLDREVISLHRVHLDLLLPRDVFRPRVQHALALDGVASPGG